MKKQYRNISMAFLAMEIESSILAGSETNCAMKMNTVEVEDFTQGFEGDGFQEITFD